MNENGFRLKNFEGRETEKQIEACEIKIEEDDPIEQIVVDGCFSNRKFLSHSLILSFSRSLSCFSFSHLSLSPFPSSTTLPQSLSL